MFIPCHAQGSGTLCEQLLMVQAYAKSIVAPNKHASEPEAFYKVSVWAHSSW